MGKIIMSNRKEKLSSLTFLSLILMLGLNSCRSKVDNKSNKNEYIRVISERPILTNFTYNVGQEDLIFESHGKLWSDANYSGSILIKTEETRDYLALNYLVDSIVFLNDNQIKISLDTLPKIEFYDLDSMESSVNNVNVIQTNLKNGKDQIYSIYVEFWSDDVIFYRMDKSSSNFEPIPIISELMYESYYLVHYPRGVDSSKDTVYIFRRTTTEGIWESAIDL